MQAVNPKIGPKKTPHKKEKEIVRENCTSKTRISSKVLNTTESAVNSATKATFLLSVKSFKKREDRRIFFKIKNLFVNLQEVRFYFRKTFAGIGKSLYYNGRESAPQGEPFRLQTTSRFATLDARLSTLQYGNYITRLKRCQVN